MSFKTDGFLSPTMSGFTVGLRKVPAYKLWFDFAEDLNRLGAEMLEGHETLTTDNQKLITCVFFIRAHQTFQAAILLMDKGLLSGARVVLRSAVEDAIALNALAADASFDMKLIEAHLHNQRKIARITVTTPEYRSGYSPEQIAEMEATIAGVAAREKAACKEFRDINWAAAAAKPCKDLYDLVYRALSNDGTHTNINAIHRLTVYDASGRLVDFRLGPQNHDMVEVFKLACLTFLWAAEPFARTHAHPFTDRIARSMKQFEQLPHDEPTDVSVRASFEDEGRS